MPRGDRLRLPFCGLVFDFLPTRSEGRLSHRGGGGLLLFEVGNSLEDDRDDRGRNVPSWYLYPAGGRRIFSILYARFAETQELEDSR